MPLKDNDLADFWPQGVEERALGRTLEEKAEYESKATVIGLGYFNFD